MNFGFYEYKNRCEFEETALKKYGIDPKSSWKSSRKNVVDTLEVLSSFFFFFKKILNYRFLIERAPQNLHLG